MILETPRNSRTNFNVEREKVIHVGYRYITHLHCLAVQTSFYSDAVMLGSLVGSPVGQVRRFFLHQLHLVLLHDYSKVNIPYFGVYGRSLCHKILNQFQNYYTLLPTIDSLDLKL